MGASGDFRLYRTNDRQAIQRAWVNDVAASRRSDGAEYSGCIGMLTEGIGQWIDKRFAAVEDAYRYIEDHHEDKWGPPLAVSVLLNNPPTDADIEQAKKHEAKALEIERAILVFMQAQVVEIQKEPFITCNKTGTIEVWDEATAKYRQVSREGCKSRIATKFVGHGLTCPLCRVTLVGPRLLGKIAAMRAEQTAEAKKAKALRSGSKSDKIGWVVGGMCAS